MVLAPTGGDGLRSTGGIYGECPPSGDSQIMESIQTENSGIE